MKLVSSDLPLGSRLLVPILSVLSVLSVLSILSLFSLTFIAPSSNQGRYLKRNSEKVHSDVRLDEIDQAILIRTHQEGQFLADMPLEETRLAEISEALHIERQELRRLLTIKPIESHTSGEVQQFGSMYSKSGQIHPKNESTEARSTSTSYINMYSDCTSRFGTPLVTVFTTMHPAKDPLKILAQRNTLQAYANLKPFVHSLVFTRDPYWQNEAKKLGIQVEDTFEVNPYGTPLLRNMYVKAFASSQAYFAAYANADILIGEDFVQSVCAVANAIRKGVVKKRVFVVGQRLNYKLGTNDVISSDKEDHERKLSSWNRNSELFQANAEDYFIVSRQTFVWAKMPEYVIGRPSYDNCLVNQAVIDSQITTIDSTGTISALHQTGDDGNKAGHVYRADLDWNMRYCSKGYQKGSVKNCEMYSVMYQGKVTLRKRKTIDEYGHFAVSWDDS